MLSKEEIEKAKEGLRKMLFNTQEANNCGLSTNDFKEDIKILEDAMHYIDQLEQENKKQNKIIDKMALEIASCDNDETFCKEIYPNNSCEGNGIPCWKCIKKYFEKKAEEK